jgi:hypothetical protein
MKSAPEQNCNIQGMRSVLLALKKTNPIIAVIDAERQNMNVLKKINIDDHLRKFLII